MIWYRKLKTNSYGYPNEMDMRTQAEKDLFSLGQPVEVKGPQYYGPPAPRKHKKK